MNILSLHITFSHILIYTAMKNYGKSCTYDDNKKSNRFFLTQDLYDDRHRFTANRIYQKKSREASNRDQNTQEQNWQTVLVVSDSFHESIAIMQMIQNQVFTRSVEHFFYAQNAFHFDRYFPWRCDSVSKNKKKREREKKFP